MAVLFGRRQRAVESLIEEYLDRVHTCIDCLESCVESSLSGEPFATVVEKAIATDRAESRADDTRREITILLYGKALFPESRGDILTLLESTDRIANAAESVARQFQHERVQIPLELRAGFRELVSRSCHCARELLKAVRMLFDDYNAAIHVADRVDDLESRADEKEIALIESLFRSGLSTGEKLLLRDVVRRISNIADHAESAGDRVRIAAIKRKI